MKLPARWQAWAAIAFGLFLLVIIVCAIEQTLADPVVRRAEVIVSDWPAGEPPRTVLLIADVHVAGPDMPPDRLARVVERLNRLNPDLILLGGDFISEKRVATRLYRPAEIVKVLAQLRAPLGVVAVLGNHDHWAGASEMRKALSTAPRITLLTNQAARRGPFVIGGVDDAFTSHDDLPRTLTAMESLGAGPRLILTHSPDIVPQLPRSINATFAGHTHCGQIALPIIGPIATMSRYGNRFACGEIRDNKRPVFVTAGLGTSILPIRFGARPDVWLVRFSSGK